MSDVPGFSLSHEGAWTEDAYLALETAGRRIELIDGSLLVGPTADDPHARAVAAVRAAVQAVLPDGLEITGPVALRLSPGRILVPDLVVAARAESGSGSVRDSSVALIVIDVVGQGHGVADRWFKPQLYAGSRIPYALLVDHDEPFAVASMLIGGRYHEYAAAEGYGVLRLEEPFPLDLDLAGLTVTTPLPAAADDGAVADGAAADTEPPTGGPSAGESEVEESCVEEPAPASATPASAASDGGSDGDPDHAGDGGPGQRGPGPGPGPGPGDGGSGGGAPEYSGSRDAAGESGSADADDSVPAGGVPGNGAGPRHELNGTATPDPDRSHPDEDHSVHA